MVANHIPAYLVAEIEDVTPNGSSYPPTEGALLGSLRAVNRSRSSPNTSPGLPDAGHDPGGNRLRLTLSTVDAPHLTPLPGVLPKLVGGSYSIARSPSAPSSLTVETLR